jgi:preprotein translocase subunit SecE
MLWVRVPPGVPFLVSASSSNEIMFLKIISFLGEVKGELRKASWPWESDPKIKGLKKYKELVDSTIVVLIAMVLLAGFVQFWDFFDVLIVGFFTNFDFGR